MKIAAVTSYDARDSKAFGGRGYYMAQSLKNQSILIDYVGPLSQKTSYRVDISALIAVKEIWYNYLLKKRYTLTRDRVLIKYYAHRIKKKLDTLNVDVVFSFTSPGSQPIAYLETEKPMVMWTDAPFAGVVNWYPDLTNLCDETIQDGIANERSALEKCSLVFFKTNWAANIAIQHYNLNAKKVKVVPGGPHLECETSLEDVKNMINSRSSEKCKLLFIGIGWKRKGGAIALQVANELNKMGLKTELTIAGSRPEIKPHPKYVNILGYLDKSTKEGLQEIKRILAESHFLILPSNAECTGVVLMEASSFGLPSLTTKVGGLPDIVRDGVNGMTFSIDADVSKYCTYVYDLFSDYKRYKELATSSFNEYQSRLNWKVAGETIKANLNDLM